MSALHVKLTRLHDVLTFISWHAALWYRHDEPKHYSKYQPMYSIQVHNGMLLSLTIFCDPAITKSYGVLSELRNYVRMHFGCLDSPLFLLRKIGAQFGAFCNAQIVAWVDNSPAGCQRLTVGLRIRSFRHSVEGIWNVGLLLGCNGRCNGERRRFC